MRVCVVRGSDWFVEFVELSRGVWGLRGASARRYGGWSKVWTFQPLDRSVPFVCTAAKWIGGMGRSEVTPL